MINHAFHVAALQAQVSDQWSRQRRCSFRPIWQPNSHHLYLAANFSVQQQHPWHQQAQASGRRAIIDQVVCRTCYHGHQQAGRAPYVAAVSQEVVIFTGQQVSLNWDERRRSTRQQQHYLVVLLDFLVVYHCHYIYRYYRRCLVFRGGPSIIICQAFFIKFNRVLKRILKGFQCYGKQSESLTVS